MNRTHTLPLWLCIAAAVLPGQPRVIATGLQAPQRLLLTNGGNFLVTETSKNPNSGRVSFVTRSGTRRSLIENLPSGTVVTGDAGGPTGMALSGRTLYLAIGAGDTERTGPRPGTSIPNPTGPSSPLFCSILEFEFNAEVDNVGATFRLTPESQRQLADGFTITLQDSSETVRVRVLADFPDAEPDANKIYRFGNPFGISLEPETKSLYVADASLDALVRVDIETGRVTRLIRFPPTPNPTPVGGPVIEPVPTSVRPFGQYLLVSFLTGFPFIPNTARVALIDPVARTVSPFIQWHTSVTDVLVRTTSSGATQFFVLEFSQNMTAQPPVPGRLLRYDGAAPAVVGTVPAAVSVALEESTNTAFVLSVTGQIFEFRM